MKKEALYVKSYPPIKGKVKGTFKLTAAGEELINRLFAESKRHADRIKRDRRFRRFCRRPHVYHDDGHAWCGLPSEQVEHMHFRDDVPPSAGFCAHCRAAYRRNAQKVYYAPCIVQHTPEIAEVRREPRSIAGNAPLIGLVRNPSIL